MKFKHIFWPVLLIGIGLLFILNNTGVINFSWRMLWNLWPLILIFWGIAILPMRDLYKSIAAILVLAFTLTFFNRITDDGPWDWIHIDRPHHSGWNWDDDDDTNTEYSEQDLTVPFDSNMTQGVLKLEAAAGNFVISGMTSEYLSFRKKGDIGNYSLTTEDLEGTKTIKLSLEEGHVRTNMKHNKVEIGLNEKPSWDLDFEVGAADMELDLRNYKVGKVNLDAGASAIEVVLGEKSPLTRLSLNAGASSIQVKVPASSGCQIKSESFMISREFKGFTKKGDRTYETPGFETAANKIYIDVETAVSKIKVDRY